MRRAPSRSPLPSSGWSQSLRCPLTYDGLGKPLRGWANSTACGSSGCSDLSSQMKGTGHARTVE